MLIFWSSKFFRCLSGCDTLASYCLLKVFPPDSSFLLLSGEAGLKLLASIVFIDHLLTVLLYYLIRDDWVIVGF